VSAEVGHNSNPWQPFSFERTFPPLQVRPAQIQAESGRACIFKRIAQKNVAGRNLGACQAYKKKYGNSETRCLEHDEDSPSLASVNPSVTRKLSGMMDAG